MAPATVAGDGGIFLVKANISMTTPQAHPVPDTMDTIIRRRPLIFIKPIPTGGPGKRPL